MTTPDLITRLLAQADEIDRAVARDKDDRDNGLFAEIELMREAADALEAALAVTEPFANYLREREEDGDMPPIRTGQAWVEMMVSVRALRAIRDWRAGIIGGER